MNAVVSPRETAPLWTTSRDAATHFQLASLGVIAHIIEEHAEGDLAATFAAHGFLAEYYGEIARVLDDEADAGAWRNALRIWERDAPRSLPLLALREAGLSDLELELLLATGLVDEDPRFGAVFDHGPLRQRRATFSLLLAWWRADPSGQDRLDEVRRALLNLLRIGLLKVADPSVPRADWPLAVPGPVWDALRAEAPEIPWLKHIGREKLLPLDRYLAPSDIVATSAALPLALGVEPQQLILLRGPRNNGRKTLAGGIAHALGKGLLVATELAVQDETHWRQFLVLALMLNALPVLDLELTPGGNRVLPAAPLGSMPLVVVTGSAGAAAMSDGRPTLTVTLPLPDVRQRPRHWAVALTAEHNAALAKATHSLRLTSGNIRRAARTALNIARLARRSDIQPEDLRLACRSLQADRLETLAARLETSGTLADLAIDEPTREELDALLARCRHRERLAEHGPMFARGAVGVRALLAGASGTGKTLATRLLAAELGKDLYRVDLAATVNKYLGETEKNLDRAFAAAEELDVVLLLDEGDALMASRTDVSSANDRYANLETNFLLQRIDGFSGILLVTSNAADRIDKAFARRMDVVIHFRAPDEWSRREILRMHLQSAAVSAAWLDEIACRCMLSGGQLRNVASHAALLSLQSGTELGDDHVYAALLREYRKTGALCPLRRPRASSD